MILRRKKTNHTKTSVGNGKMIKYVVLLLFLFLVYKIFKIATQASSIVKNADKVVLAVRQDDNDVHIHIIDPTIRSYTILNIPSETLVNTSHSLGDWRVGSLWELGVNDHVYGDYMQKSITRTFNIPVLFWADSMAENLAGTGVNGLFKFLGSGYLSNMNLSDKIAIYYYASKINKSERNLIELKETSFIKSGKLPDGEDGFWVSDAFPQYLLPLFSHKDISLFKIKLVNSGLREYEVKNVSDTIEVLGGKVAFVEKSENKDFVCMVSSKTENVEKLFSQLYSCKSYSIEKEKGGFDLIIFLGTGFSSTN